MVSRKVIMLVVGLLTAVATALQKEVGISLDAGQAVAGLGVFMVWIFGEFKSDMNRVKMRIYELHKWKDPVFWTALGAGILPVISQYYQIAIPVEAINTVIACLLGLVFRKRVRNARKERG